MPAAPPIIRDGPVNVPLDYNVPTASEIIPIAVSATFTDSGNAGPYVPALVILTPNGQQLGPYPLGLAVAAGASARVSWFPGGDLDLAQAASPGVGITQEVFYVDSITGTPVTSVTTLSAGVSYVVIIEGTYSDWNQTLPTGTPEADAMFPGSTAGRVSTEVGLDPECIFASPAGDGVGHTNQQQISLDGGATFNHLEPVGGPFGTPQVGHLYRYELVGQGHPLKVELLDSTYTDNYGKVRVTIQIPSGTGTGSGAGSLVPAADSTNSDQVLAVLGGVPQFTAVDGGSA